MSWIAPHDAPMAVLLTDPPVRWVHLAGAIVWPSSALLGMWKARSLRRRRSRRTVYALVAVGFIVGAENLLQALSPIHPAGLPHLVANALLAGAGAVALFAMGAYGTEAVNEERVLYAISRGHLARDPIDRRLPRPLTQRELEVLTCLCQGLRPEDIARRLGISPHTATTHVRNLMKKLKAPSRVDAISWAIRTGLYDPTTGKMAKSGFLDSRSAR